MAKIGRETLNCLDVIQEECAEIIKVISKIKRFGFGDVYKEESNIDRLASEYGDLVGAFELLEELEPELLDNNFYDIFTFQRKQKPAKVTKYYNSHTVKNEQE